MNTTHAARLFPLIDRSPLNANLLSHAFRFATGNGLFSADRIDDGTKLLLAALPDAAPTRVLDLGAGYGALGLPIAATHPNADVDLVDRDLLAVAYAARNAEAHSLTRVRAFGSLGYRDVSDTPYDWILSNVPARIGDGGIRYLLTEGARRLSARGEMRIVVIAELSRAVLAAAQSENLQVTHVSRSNNHFVYRIAPQPRDAVVDHEAVYARDEVVVDGQVYARPHDISEEPEHLKHAIPMLLEVMPKACEGMRGLVLRGGYGIAARVLGSRRAKVTSVDRDLLADAYTQRNAAPDAPLETHCDAYPLGSVAEDSFDFAVAEVSELWGPKALSRELLDLRARLKKGGDALWMGRKKLMESVFEHLPQRPRLLVTRGNYSVYRDSRAHE